MPLCTSQSQKSCRVNTSPIWEKLNWFAQSKVQQSVCVLTTHDTSIFSVSAVGIAQSSRPGTVRQAPLCPPAVHVVQPNRADALPKIRPCVIRQGRTKPDRQQHNKEMKFVIFSTDPSQTLSRLWSKLVKPFYVRRRFVKAHMPITCSHST